MENRTEFLTEVLRLQQRNYVQMTEIEKLTKEIGDSLSRSDKESVQILLGMRADEMEKASETKRGIHAILQAADIRTREEIRALLNGSERSGMEDFESGKIFELGRQIQRVLERTIALDKAISCKLAGTDSYYKTKQ